MYKFEKSLESLVTKDPKAGVREQFNNNRNSQGLPGGCGWRLSPSHVANTVLVGNRPVYWPNLLGTSTS